MFLPQAMLQFLCSGPKQEDYRCFAFKLFPDLLPELGVCRGRGDNDHGVMMTHLVRVRGHQEAHIVSVHHMELVTGHQG